MPRDQNQILRTVIDALTATFFISPRDHGLSFAELLELGKSHDFRHGELLDAVNGASEHTLQGGHSRYKLGDNYILDLVNFHGYSEDDLRSIDCFEYVWKYLHELDRDAGRGKGRVNRGILIQDGCDKALPKDGIETAIGIYLHFDMLKLVDEDIQNGKLSSWGDGPKSQLAAGDSRLNRRSGAKKLLSEVRDIILRRTDGRPLSKEPIEAFLEALDSLGLSNLKSWWNAIASDLRRASPDTAPTSVIVLSAALGEAALCAVGQRARCEGDSMKGMDWDKPKTWKFESLIHAAKRGQAPIFDGTLGARAIRLNELRQRIHAGRFWLPDHRVGRFDLRPDEAREAQETLDQLLRCLLIWLDAHQSSTSLG